MQKSRKIGMLAAAALLAAAGWVGPAVAAGEVVKVSATETTADMDPTLTLGMATGGDMSKATMFLKATPATVPAGEVTFELSNASKTLIHEMVVSTAIDPTKPLPYNANENRVDEDAAGHLGEVAEIDPGKTGSVTLTLKPGTYLLYCNVPGHYMAGMWTIVTVN